MHRFSTILVAALLAAPVAAAAPPTDDQRLTPAQIQQVLDDAAAKREANEQALDAAHAGPDVHGELGVEVGTGGYRSIFGTAVVGFGNSGGAIVSFDSTHFNARSRDRY